MNRVDSTRQVADSGSAAAPQSGLQSAVVVRQCVWFPREARLLQRVDYDRVFQSGRRYRNRYWTLIVQHEVKSNRPMARLGLAIAKKRARRAVDRNRIKRVARESFRHWRSQLGPLDVVVMNGNAASDAEAKALRQSLDELFGQIASRSLSGRGG